MSDQTGIEIQPQIYSVHDELNTLFKLADSRNEKGMLLSSEEIQLELRKYNLEELFPHMYLDMFKDSNKVVNYERVTKHILRVLRYPLSVETIGNEGLTHQRLSISGIAWFREIQIINPEAQLELLSSVASITLYLPQFSVKNAELIMKISKQSIAGFDQGRPSIQELEDRIICCINYEYVSFPNINPVKTLEAKMWLEVKKVFTLFGIDLPIQLIEN